jgi:maltose O-acetyltransferase
MDRKDKAAVRSRGLRAKLLREPGRVFWWLVYTALASRLPSWSRSAKRFRVFCARRFCADVHPTANINAHAILSWSSRIGAHGGVGAHSRLGGPVTIGAHVTMGPDVHFITGIHPVPGDYGSFRDMPASQGPIVVEDDVFIGARVTILPGVTVGRGAAIGAGSVVPKDVAPGATVVGNPAREVRRRQV